MSDQCACKLRRGRQSIREGPAQSRRLCQYLTNWPLMLSCHNNLQHGFHNLLFILKLLQKSNGSCLPFSTDRGYRGDGGMVKHNKQFGKAIQSIKASPSGKVMAGTCQEFYFPSRLTWAVGRWQVKHNKQLGKPSSQSKLQRKSIRKSHHGHMLSMSSTSAAHFCLTFLDFTIDMSCVCVCG